MTNDSNGLVPNAKRLPAPATTRALSPAELLAQQQMEPLAQILDASSGSGLVEYWKIVVRHKGTVIMLLFLGGVVGFFSAIPQTPIYRARATVEVQGLNQDFLNLKEVTPTSTGISLDPSADILTQVKLLESQSLRERTVSKLKSKPSNLSVRGLGGSRLLAWEQILKRQNPQSLSWEDAIGMAAGSLAVRASGTTRIMDVAADSADPGAAASFVNALINEFIEQDLEGRLTSSELTNQWLTRQLDDLKIKLEKSEDQLQGYASGVGLQMTGGGDGKDDHAENVANSRLRALQTELLAAHAERVKAQSKYELVSAAPLDSLPQVLDDSNLKEYLNKLAELRRQMAELRVTMTRENPKVEKIRQQIEEVENSFAAERQNVVSRIKNDFDSADRREKLISADYEAQLKLVNAQASQAIHYDILKREADTNRQIYEAMLQKVKEAGVATALRASNYRIVDPAKAPRSPYKPNPSQSSMIGSVGGLIVGILFVLVRERADRSLQQPGDSAYFLDLPELGVIPSDRIGPAAKLYGGRPRQSMTVTPGHLQEVALATYKRRPSLLAESFHDTLTSILFSGPDGTHPKVIALCSPGPSEGKSTIASNLAAALADINQKVLLIDADMRRPRQHRVFEISNSQGLSTLIREQGSILNCPGEPFIFPTEVPNLSLMPSGPAVSNASNLLYSPRVAEMIQAARQEFNFVLIDTPPMLQIADARILGQHCDTVILVVRAGKTTRDAARAAKTKFQHDGTPVLGTILNDWVPGLNGYGYDSKYYDRYAKYYNVKKAKKEKNEPEPEN